MRYLFLGICLTGCLWGDKGGYGIDTAEEAGYVIVAVPYQLPEDGEVSFDVEAVKEDLSDAELIGATWSNPEALHAEQWVLPAETEWKVVRLTHVVKDADGKQIGYGSETLDLPFEWEVLECSVVLDAEEAGRWEASCAYDACDHGADPSDGFDCTGDTVLMDHF